MLHHRHHSTQNHTNSREREPSLHWTYHYAAHYVERGFSVIPLAPNSKQPAIAWKCYQSQRPSETDLRDWFSHDTYNIGIVTGRISSLVVIDADTAEEAVWCQKTFPPTPLTVTTGRGGSHFYYQLPSDIAIGNRARVFGRAIDIRGEGGFVCAPPSIHPNGNSYSWANFGDNFCWAEVPVFQNTWLPTQRLSSEIKPNGHQSVGVRSSRSAARIRGLIRHLDKEVPDRSARDWAVVQGLRRLGCSRHEVSRLVQGHSKFHDEVYLELTVANAFATENT